jgi:hypothetical protein
MAWEPKSRRMVRLSSLEDAIEEKAKTRTFLTLKALDRMCRGHQCAKSEVDQCLYREKIFNGVLDLASKGFTVTEVQCQAGNPVDCGDPDQWETVCANCLEKIGTHEKQTCEHRKSAEKMLLLLETQGFLVKKMFCQFNPFKKDYPIFSEHR